MNDLETAFYIFGEMNWITQNWIEIIGAIAGFIYVFFEIKANKWMWPIGLLTSAFYIVVFFDSKFYADMSLQFYYIVISVIGWYWWLKGGTKGEELSISKIKTILIPKLFLGFLLIFIAISYILVYYTDSPLPYWDALTTSLSIVATWMLARKILEQWLLWVFIDLVSMILYIYKGLYPTSILFLIYSILAIIGYKQWKKSLSNVSK